jgi:hypothetical protein
MAKTICKKYFFLLAYVIDIRGRKCDEKDYTKGKFALK